MKELSPKKQLAINLIAAAVGVAFNIGINFFISPYVVKHLGAEANGFLGLGNTFVSFAWLVTIALNSMSSRFIMIEVQRGNIEKANMYYTSTFYGNLSFVIIFAVVSIITISYLDKIINIPNVLIVDVKLLFAFLFLNFIITNLFCQWSVPTFIKNKMYLNNIATIFSQLLHAALLVLLFVLFPAKVLYKGIAVLAGTIFVTICRYFQKRTLMPEINVKSKYFSKYALIEIVTSGLWNSFSSGGTLLLSGLQLLIANLFVNPTAMGALALAKTVPVALQQLSSSIVAVFNPSLITYYALGDIHRIKSEIKRNMKIVGLLVSIPYIWVIVLGVEFFSLWVPSEDAALIHRLSLLSCVGLIFTCTIPCLTNIFIVVNKLKTYSLLTFLSGALSVVCVLSTLSFGVTNEFGVYVIVGIGSVFQIAICMFYIVPFSALFLKLKWNTFFPEVLINILGVCVIAAICYVIKQFYVINSWFTLSVSAVFISLVGIIVYLIIVFNKPERKYLLNLASQSIKKIKLSI